MKILKGMIVVEKATGKTLVVEDVKDGVLYLSNNTRVPERLVREVFSSGEYPDGFQFNAELVDGKLIVNGLPINTGSLKIQKIVAQCNGQLYLTVENVKHRDKIDVFCYDLKKDQFEKFHNSWSDAKPLLNQNGVLVYQLEDSAEHTMGVTENGEPIVGSAGFTKTIIRYKGRPFFRANSAEVGDDFGDIRDVRTNGESTVILALSNMRPVTMTDINGERFVTFEDAGKPVTASIFRLRTRVNEFGREEFAFDHNAFNRIRTDVVGEVKDWEYYPGLNAYVLKGTKGVSVITFADGDKEGKIRDFCFDVSLLDDADVMSVDLGDGRRNSITIGKIADDGTVSAKKVVVTSGTDRGYVTEVIDL